MIKIEMRKICMLLTWQTANKAVAMETLRAATVSAVVGVDADGILRARVVHSAGWLTHAADARLCQSAVLVDVADHYATRGQEGQSRESKRERTVKCKGEQLSQERLRLMPQQLYNYTTFYTVNKYIHKSQPLQIKLILITDLYNNHAFTS